ncbi:MAG TPA: hypothetical protein VF485_10515 [Sphingomonas sp.]
MIPWFIVNAIDAITSRVGYDMTVEWRSDRRWTVERFWLHRRPAGMPRPAKLGPYRGGPLVAADNVGPMCIGMDVVTDGIGIYVPGRPSCRELTRADPFTTCQ